MNILAKNAGRSRQSTTSISEAPLVQRSAWKKLESHYRDIRDQHLRELFSGDPKRGTRLTAEAVDIFLDYSKQRISDETIKLLLDLAEEVDLRSRIDAMFDGEKINITENRAVLHVALRAPRDASIIVDGENVVPQVHSVLDKMGDFANRVRSGEWKGHTGKRIRNVINIGIGGSDLGPVMAYEALKHYSDRSMAFRFVSNIDGTDLMEATADLDPAATLFIVSSKTFTTLETMTNAHRRASGCYKRSAMMRARWRSISWPFRRMPPRSPNSASIRPICLSFGIGWAAAIRWIQPSVYPPCWPSGQTTFATCLPAFTKWTSTFALHRSIKTCRF